MENDCIFCKIIAGEIPGEILHEDEETIAFRDISPQSPVHLLIIPRRHITKLADVTEADLSLMGHMINVANQLAKREGVSESGYRLVINCGREGGQMVPHLHVHLMGGRELSGMMG